MKAWAWRGINLRVGLEIGQRLLRMLRDGLRRPPGFFILKKDGVAS
jgi:hypothetical protein